MAQPEEALKGHSPLSQVAALEAPHGVLANTAPRARAPLIDIPSPMRLRNHLQHWNFASPMTQKIIRRGLTWKWNPKPPPLQLPPPSTCRGNLYPHISKLLQSGAVISVPLQPCFPNRVFSGPKGNWRRAPNNRPLPPEHIHSLPHLQDAGRGKDQTLNPKTSLVHVHRPFRRIPSRLHPPKVSKIPCLHIRQPALLLPSYAIRVEPGPNHIHQSNHGGAQVPPCPASVYIDDWILWSTSPETLTTNTTFTTTLLQGLGFTINWEKSQLNPSRTLVYLGVPWGWGSAHSRSQPPQHKQGNHPHLRSPLQGPPHKETLRETVGHSQLCSPVCLPGEVPPATSHPKEAQHLPGLMNIHRPAPAFRSLVARLYQYTVGLLRLIDIIDKNRLQD